MLGMPDRLRADTIDRFSPVLNSTLQFLTTSAQTTR